MDITSIFSQQDPVLIGTFIILIIMSMLTWFIIVAKGISIARTRRQTRLFLKSFWTAPGLDAAARELDRGANPPSRVAKEGLDALQHYRIHVPANLGESCTGDEFLTRAIRNAISKESARLESGLSVLASVGSTAPFVGLFGTVWGIYRALTNIAAQGQATLDVVAGPMGEALVATAAGLAAAIPAVLAYNAFVRGNRVLLAELDAFAHDLHAVLSTGGRVNGTRAVTPIREVA
jgi:biopolymer transport protein ExbB